MNILIFESLHEAINNPTKSGREIKSVTSAALRERLNGELSLTFSILMSENDGGLIANGQLGVVADADNNPATPLVDIITVDGLPISLGMCVKYDEQIYTIVRSRRAIAGGLYTADIECEHCSYLLNDEAYLLTDWTFSGTPAAGLYALLAGTPLSVGTVERTTPITLTLPGETTRRAAVMYLTAESGGEIEYNGGALNIRNHRGSVAPIEIMDGQHVTDLTVTYDTISDVEAYELSAFKHGMLALGDEVHIVFIPLNIDRFTRIIGIEYNPFYQYDIRIEVGAYVPEFVGADAIKVAGLASDLAGIDERVTEAENSIVQINVTTDSLTVAIDAGVQESKSYAAGLDTVTRQWASSELSLTAEQFSVSLISGIEDSKNYAAGLDTSTRQWATSQLTLTSEAFTLSLESGIEDSKNYAAGLDGTNRTWTNSQIKVTSDALTVKIQNSDGNISTLSQTVSGIYTSVSALSQTVAGQTTSISTLSQTATSLSTSVSSLSSTVSGHTSSISTLTQTASKIEWVVSGTSSSTFGLTTRMTSLITQEVDNITLSVTNGTTSSTFSLKLGTTTLSSGSISFTGFVTFSALSGSGTTTINGANITTGTISADRIDATSLKVAKVYASTSSSIAMIELYNSVLYMGTSGSNSTCFIKCEYGEISLGGTTASSRNLRVTSAGIGFFATSPTYQRSVSSSADVSTLITALKAYGLIS
jgi:hypothetical protein